MEKFKVGDKVKKKDDGVVMEVVEVIEKEGCNIRCDNTVMYFENELELCENNDDLLDLSALELQNVELRKKLEGKERELYGLSTELVECEEKLEEINQKYQSKKADIEVMEREKNDYMMFWTMQDKPELNEFVKHRLEFVSSDSDNKVVEFMDKQKHIPVEITTDTLVFLEGDEVYLYKSYDDYNEAIKDYSELITGDLAELQVKYNELEDCNVKLQKEKQELVKELERANKALISIIVDK